MSVIEERRDIRARLRKHRFSRQLPQRCGSYCHSRRRRLHVVDIYQFPGNLNRILDSFPVIHSDEVIPEIIGYDIDRFILVTLLPRKGLQQPTTFQRLK